MKNLVSIALILLVDGCSSPDHVSVTDFKKEYAMVGQPQSMRNVSYLGVRDGRAILKVSSMPLVGSEWQDRTIYVRVSELDEAFVRSLPSEPIQPSETTRGKSP